MNREVNDPRASSRDPPKLKVRSKSLEAKSEDPSFELLRQNTRHNARPSGDSFLDYPPRKAKTSKKVVFADLVPSASQYFEDVTSEPVSFTLAPLTVDTGSDLSFDDFMPELSFEEDKEVVLESSIPSPTPAFSENNTIIKRKKLQEKYVEIEYYLDDSGEDSSGSDQSFEQEMEDLVTAVSNRNMSDSSTSGSGSKGAHNKNLGYTGPITGEDYEFESSKTIEKEDVSGAYMNLLEKFMKLEASHAILLEENKQHSSKYDDLQSRFSKLEALYAQSQQDNKSLQRRLLTASADNKAAAMKLAESRKTMSGLSREVQALQMQCKTQKKQMEVYDREMLNMG